MQKYVRDKVVDYGTRVKIKVKHKSIFELNNTIITFSYPINLRSFSKALLTELDDSGRLLIFLDVTHPGFFLFLSMDFMTSNNIPTTDIEIRLR